LPRRHFADEAEITVKAGNGGAGCVSFERLRFKPRGAADGGDGGRGGNVSLVLSNSLRTLANFRHQQLFRAQNGQPGRSRLKTGAQGADLTIAVPPGTVVSDLDSGQVLGDLVEAHHTLVVAVAGRGGKGNAHFGSSRLRSPRFAQPGEPGQERRLRLELQLLADVGLIGLPNAGKTTLLTKLTASKAEASPYPFSTLEPNLGVLQHDEHDPIVVADIPGLIEGAHTGKGLGQRFLRHLKRNRLLLHVVDATQIDPQEPFATADLVLAELQAFEPDLLLKKHLVILNKIDLLPRDFPLAQVIAAFTRRGWRCLPLSAHTGESVPLLKEFLWSEIEVFSHATPQ
jgi:GTP-binding protein